MKNLLFPMNLFGLLSFLILIPIFVQFVRIIISTKQKYRYYKITKYRLENREFKEEFFIVEMYEPCFRLIVKDLVTIHHKKFTKNRHYPLFKEIQM